MFPTCQYDIERMLRLFRIEAMSSLKIIKADKKILLQECPSQHKPLGKQYEI